MKPEIVVREVRPAACSIGPAVPSAGVAVPLGAERLGRRVLRLEADSALTTVVAPVAETDGQAVRTMQSRVAHACSRPPA